MNETTRSAQDSPAVGSLLDREVGPLVEKLRERRQAVAWSRGQDTDYPTKWEPDALCQQAADEIARLTAALKQANDQYGWGLTWELSRRTRSARMTG